MVLGNSTSDDSCWMMPMRRHLNSTAFLKSSWELSTQEINIMMQNWYIFQRILSSYISFVSIRGISCIQSQVEMRKLVSRCWIKSRPSPRMKVTDLNEELNLTRITPGSQNRSWQMIKYQAQQRGLGAHSWIWYVIAAKPLSYNKGKKFKNQVSYFEVGWGHTCILHTVLGFIAVTGENKKQSHKLISLDWWSKRRQCRQERTWGGVEASCLMLT